MSSFYCCIQYKILRRKSSICHQRYIRCGKIYLATKYYYDFIISLTVKSEFLYHSRKIQDFVIVLAQKLIIKLYFQNFSSRILSQCTFKKAYLNRKAPHRETIRRLANVFSQNGAQSEVKHT